MCILQAFRNTLLFIVLGQWTPGAHAENEHGFAVLNHVCFQGNSARTHSGLLKSFAFDTLSKEFKFVVHKRHGYSLVQSGARILSENRLTALQKIPKGLDNLLSHQL